MKHFNFLSIVLIACCVMSSCSQRSKFENAAKKQLKIKLKEVANDPSNIKLSNIETVFCDDSLCICHADFVAKNNGLGIELKFRCEYIFIGSKGKNYESYRMIEDDEGGIFINPEKYEKNKKGTIYEPLSYEAGLRYLAARYVNRHGKEAGISDGESFSIPVPTGTGSWELKPYKDEFGKETGEKYLVLMGEGVFSNSATTNSEMGAVLFVEKDYEFSFKLVEYGSIVVQSDASYDYRIKDSSEEIHEMTLYNSDRSGQMFSSSPKDKEIMKNILEKGGIVTFAVKERRRYSAPNSYLFKLDVTGFKNAISYLRDTNINTINQ